MRGLMVVIVVVLGGLAPAADAAQLRITLQGNGFSGHALYPSVELRDDDGARDVVTASLTGNGVGRIKNSTATLTAALPTVDPFGGLAGTCVVGPLGHEADCVAACV